MALNLICLPDLCNILECKLTIQSLDGVDVNLCQLLKTLQYSVKDVFLFICLFFFKPKGIVECAE